MKIDKIFSDKIVLSWQQHLSRYLENRSSYLNKSFTDLHHLSKATCYQRIQNFRSFHVIMDQYLMVTVSFPEMLYMRHVVKKPVCVAVLHNNESAGEKA